jgi:hypothetical protein
MGDREGRRKSEGECALKKGFGKRQTLTLVVFALDRGGAFAIGFLGGFTADSIHRTLSLFLELTGKLICTGTRFGGSGLSPGKCFLGGLLSPVTQLNGFILDQSPGLFTGLRSEKQSHNCSTQTTHQESYEKGAKFITIRHSNLLQVILFFPNAQQF